MDTRGPRAEQSGRTGRPPRPAGDNAFAQTLRRAREALGLTLTDAAARAGVSPSYLSELERGSRRPSMRTVDRLTAALALDVQPMGAPGRIRVDGSIEPMLRRLAARIVVRGDASLADLALEEKLDSDSIHDAIAAVRDRLAMVGLDLIADADRVRVVAREATLAAPAVDAGESVPEREHPVHVPVRLSSPILVGRENELQRLILAVEQTPSVAVVRGEAGVTAGSQSTSAPGTMPYLSGESLGNRDLPSCLGRRIYAQIHHDAKMCRWRRCAPR